MGNVRQVLAALLAAAATTAIAAPASAQPVADEPSDAVLPKRYPPSSVRWKLVGGGLALSGAAYGTAYLCSSTWPDAPGADALKIPVVGPWIALADSGCAEDDPDCGFTAYLRGFLTIVDGFIQAGGVGIAGEGLFMTTEREAPPPTRRSAGTKVVVRPVPIVTARTTGFGVVGAF
jgi:hypothetical protein